MKPITPEWVVKAEADLLSAEREYRARKAPNYDAACFLAQQCIEKYLKACLQEASVPFGKTHDLVALLDQLEPIEPLWMPLKPLLAPISAYAVAFRYPGRSATREEAKVAIKHARRVRELARTSLRLSPKGTGRHRRSARSPSKRR